MRHCELELLRDDIVVRVIPLGEAPISLGRDLSNGVVLLDETVSNHHAVVWLAADGPHLTDLKSTNGTFHNEERVTGTASLADGDQIRLGDETRLRVRHRGSAPGALVLKDLTAGLATLLDESRCIIGSGADCHVRLSSGPERAVVLVIHDDLEVWLSDDERERPLEVGDTFQVGEHQFRLETYSGGMGATRPARERARYPYHLAVRLMGDGGPAAIFRDPSRNLEYTVTSENRVALAYVLTTKRMEELGAEMPDSEAGWCSDDDVMQGIWGRAAQRNSPSSYSVLLFRLRKELEGAGFDPWFIEKRRGATRICLKQVELL